MNSKHNPALGTPSFVDQWFSFVFEHGNVCPAFSWTWCPKPVNVLPPFQSEEVLSDVSSETIPDSILEGDDICQLLAVMDHIDVEEPIAKRKSNIFTANILLTDQSNNKKHKLTAQTNYSAPATLPCLSEPYPTKGKSSFISILKSSLQKNIRR
eukprot:CAMPEP_0206188470 /NCGR_PEP_ID=MMETSP0166-20121206/3588_1 /ASSEMBLY_ACC=CAM_ASM_000260 /TAXON_ID=95228 /ORGANISM="Vannella robusta, Strain DIVA3 518/3/11/1/6" /LENGTH=153 /DNA_ID=CAMNT_0053604193 /DNA_START=118 /DNA_END=575 /DNA_ORIENTATION=+